MKGLELARRFYDEVGAPMLAEQFPALLPYLAIGLTGSGSECDGYDDAVSRDHDFEPGFCLFLPEEDVVSRRDAFLLERAYAKLPREFMGYRRSAMDPVGGNRHGVLRTAEYFADKVGSRDGNLTLAQWFSLPDYALREATNGAIFTDPYGEVTRLRERLRYYPEEVRRKKLCGHLLLMGQAGQYNHPRCVGRGDTGAAQLAAVEFVKSAMQVCFLLDRVYMPYYKWQFRALRELPSQGGLAAPLEALLTARAEDAQATIETVCAAVAQAVYAQGLVTDTTTEMERLAYAVNNGITDNQVRNLHILAAV